MADRIVHLDSDPHAIVQKLLPWYVTGRLDAVEHAEVEQHLVGCAACRSELEFEREWQAVMKSRPAQPGDVDADWSGMRLLLDAEDATRSAGSPPRRPARARSWLDPFLPGRVPVGAWAAPALLSAALAVAIGFSFRPAAKVDEGYHALAAPAEEGATAVVRFRPEATEAEIRHGLKDSGARLVDGPTVTDAYIVRLPRDRYAAALEQLRRQPGVTLVEALESAGAR